MGIPTAKFFKCFAPEKQGRAPQGNGKAKAFQAGQNDAKPCGVFNGETARQPVGMGVIKIETPLQACHIRPALGKPVHDDMDLIRCGGIFGVIDPDD